MDSSHSLPFKVGQQAEARSFQRGFRSAWFRCKIQEICRKKGQIRYALDYFDYPDDKVKWMVLYQRPQLGPAKRRKELKAQLMLRPSFPPLYHESEAFPILGGISEDIVIVRDFWKVGDLVDWLFDGCYWSARVTRVLGDAKLMVELPRPPEGEGLSYEVPAKDLRPSLHWTPELGWTVPLPKGRGTSCCARLVRPSKGGELKAGPVFVDKMDTVSCCGAESSISSNRSPGSLPLPESVSRLGKEEKGKGVWLEDDQVDMNSTSTTSNSSNISPGCLPPLTGSLNPGRTSSRQKFEHTGQGVEAEVSSSPLVTPDGDLHAAGKDNVREISGTGDADRETGTVSYSRGLVDFAIAVKERPLEEDPLSSGVAPKKMRISRSEDLTSAIIADSTDSSLMELEELANKIRWLKGLLRCGANRPHALKPSWKFHEAD